MCSRVEANSDSDSKTVSRLDPDSSNVVASNQLIPKQLIPKQLNRLSRTMIADPATVARLVRARMSPGQEELWVLALSASKHLVGFEMIFRGTVDSCLVHPRDIIRFLCETNAASYIVAHNHPSGDAEPSDHDWIFTHRLIGCGELIEIPLLDHVIVTLKGHSSLASRRPGLFKVLCNRNFKTNEQRPNHTRQDDDLPR